MANVPCMTDGHAQAVFIGTFLESGDSIQLCNECLANFAGAITAQVNGIDLDVFEGVLKELGDASAEGLAEAAAEFAAPPAGIESPTAEQLAQEADEEGSEPLTTAEGAPTDEPPEPAPADTDREVESPPIGASGKPGSDVTPPDIASSTDASSEAESPPPGTEPVEVAEQ